jgi:DNA polymerase-3 subunit epsilon
LTLRVLRMTKERELASGAHEGRRARMEQMDPALPLSALTFAFLDVETTGLSPQAGHRVCEIAVVRSGLDEEGDTFASLVDPGRPISPGAAAVNGLCDADVRRAPRFAGIAPAVLAKLKGCVVVCHNSPFDLAFLESEMEHAGRRFRADAVVDTLALARRCYRFGSNGLPHVARALGIPTPNAHRALGDALTTREVLRRFVGDLSSKGARTLGSLLAAQDGGAVEPVRREAPTLQLPVELAEALKSGKRLLLTYVARSGVRTERWVTPEEVTTSWGTPCLVAMCHLRGDRRTFRLDRIVGMRVENG